MDGIPELRGRRIQRNWTPDRSIASHLATQRCDAPMLKHPSQDALRLKLEKARGDWKDEGVRSTYQVGRATLILLFPLFPLLSSPLFSSLLSPLPLHSSPPLPFPPLFSPSPSPLASHTCETEGAYKDLRRTLEGPYKVLVRTLEAKLSN